MKRIPCPNKRKDGMYCNATLLFVPEGARDYHLILPPCKTKYRMGEKSLRCGAMVKVDIDENGDCMCEVFKGRIDATNQPLMSQGVIE